ncbi:sulfur carrier protein [Actinopolyspora xinjiangensis]|uniref:Sulfur carrier protein n=1 Tax=Actinopolyspora xinjiangensis TaxID=405564 RepID=A0A1H0PAH7_9ACTN|nr:sulfur carrier protein ThiS [Actinopolyspora xinjiangensis]SDP01659.1 sulfur carrier protein [Actinopolyspora xinjiangensis]
MNVTINGQRYELEEGATLADALERFQSPSRGVAVALDGAVVPRDRWRDTELTTAATVEIVTAVQGG